MATWKAKEAAVRALENNGTVDPADLITAARNPNHPCHDDFTWDVEAAAMERWRDQARRLIRKCKFAVVVEDITTPVVRYVESPGDEPLFVSLPKIRSTSKVSGILSTELAMLHGNAARVYGIALSKSGIVGADVVGRLEVIRDQLAEMKESVADR